MGFSKIYSTASYVPDKVRDNAYFVQKLGTSKETGTSIEWIEKSVGFKERRVVDDPNVTHKEMVQGPIEEVIKDFNKERTSIILTGNTHFPNLIPCRAAEYQDLRKLNKDKGYHADIPAFDIITSGMQGAHVAVNATNMLAAPCGLVTAYSQTGLDDVINKPKGPLESIAYWHQTKGLAQVIAEELGMQKESSFDLITGCASFNFGLALADMIVRATKEYVVVAAVDKMLDVTNPMDRASVILFGELASAVLLGPSDTPGFIAHRMNTDGSKRDLITVKQADGWDKPYFWQNGSRVLRYAVPKVVELTEYAVEKAKKNSSNGRLLIVPHQANIARINDAAIEKPVFQQVAAVARTGVYFGNSSTASISHALDSTLREGIKSKDGIVRPEPGDFLGIMGFGAGLSDAANVYRVV